MNSQGRAPSLFVGHGSPMHALSDNAYSRMLAALGAEYSFVRAIVCISAHWVTDGVAVTHMASPKTIHDFYGFPDPLFAIQYPAPGSPKLAEQVWAMSGASWSEDWGLDHGAWTVLKHMYPAANIPVVQLSLKRSLSIRDHYTLAQRLTALRDDGVMILGSGNVVHNLRRVQWSESAQPHPWAIDLNTWVKAQLDQPERLIAEIEGHPSFALCHPTTEHLWPLLYTLGARGKDERAVIRYDDIELSSISMLTLSFG